MKHLGDITKLSGYDVPTVDVVIGGSPCQDLSVAGKQVGLKGERSGLFMEQIRLIKEMREADAARGKTNDAIRPRYMVWENVPGAFSSSQGRDFEAVLEETVRVAEPKAPPCSCPCKRVANKRMPRGRWMERCVESSRCSVLGNTRQASTTTASENLACGRFWRKNRTRDII